MIRFRGHLTKTDQRVRSFEKVNLKSDKMPPNFNDLSPPERIDVVEAPKDNVVTQEIVPSNVGIKAVRSFATLLTHILIGIIVGVSLFFSLRNGTPLGATPQHVILCVIGVSKDN